ncbi:MAG: prepilin-type N-terminal cleavage/methylation domain-containing protein [Verrucomicrobiota bacterium]
MQSKNNNESAFTLIELLMVVAIIAILAGILIPAIGAVRKQANVAASKAQISGYVNAIQMFKGEYNYLPFVTGGADTTIDLSSGAQSQAFIETLSGKDPTTGAVVQTGGNRRSSPFHSFSDSDFLLEDDNSISQTQLADRFGNVNIKVRLDGDGDGLIDPDVAGTSPASPSDPIRTNVTMWVEPDADGNPGYALWD